MFSEVEFILSPKIQWELSKSIYLAVDKAVIFQAKMNIQATTSW